MKTHSSEAVLKGHPDKLADQIADAILDAHLKSDPDARVACEVTLKKNAVILAGEISSKAQVSFEPIIRSLLKEIGYTDASWGIDAKNCEIHSYLSKQSPEIAHSLEKKGELAPGDQAIVYGYATNESKEFLPLSYVFVQNLVQSFSNEHPFSYLRPDGKAICSMRYDGNTPTYIDSIVLSLQHDETVTQKTLQENLLDYVKSFFSKKLCKDTKFYINPSGSFVIGGPNADTGMSGRKTMVDTYGTLGPHGGGSFSGKDPSKIDRTGTYAARYIAKNIVASGISRECSVQIVYVIGILDPIEINIELDSNFDTDKLVTCVKENFPLRPSDIIDAFDLKKPIYQSLAFGGHFGHDHPWEKLDKVECLQALL